MRDDDANSIQGGIDTMGDLGKDRSGASSFRARWSTTMPSRGFSSIERSAWVPSFTYRGYRFAG